MMAIKKTVESKRYNASNVCGIPYPPGCETIPDHHAQKEISKHRNADRFASPVDET